MSDYKFDSIGELLAMRAKPHVNPTNGPGKHSYYRVYDQGWICSDRSPDTQDEVSALLKAQTFKKGVDRVNRIAADLTAPAPITRARRRVHTDAGDELNISRVWDGELERAWTTTKRAAAVGPSRVLIVLNAAASFNTHAGELASRGATALAAVNALLEAGYVVSLVAAAHNKLFDAPGTDYKMSVTILEPGQALDIHKLASLIASALLFRGVMMDHMLRSNEHAVGGAVSSVRELAVKHLDTQGYDRVWILEHKEATNAPAGQSWLNQKFKELEV